MKGSTTTELPVAQTHREEYDTILLAAGLMRSSLSVSICRRHRSDQTNLTDGYFSNRGPVGILYPKARSGITFGNRVSYRPH